MPVPIPPALELGRGTSKRAYTPQHWTTLQRPGRPVDPNEDIVIPFSRWRVAVATDASAIALPIDPDRTKAARPAGGMLNLLHPYPYRSMTLSIHP